MYCTKCGAKNEDDAKYCEQCGAKLQNTVDNIKPAVLSDKHVPKKEKRGHKNIKIAPIIILIILLILVLMFPRLILSGQTEKKIVKEFVEAEMTCDADKIVEFLPEEILNAIETEGGMNKAEFTEALHDNLDSAMNTIKNTLGEDWKYSYNIKRIKSVSKEELEELKEKYRDETELDLNISEAKTAEIDLTAGDGETESSSVMDINIIKIKNKWYLDFLSMAETLL